MMRPLILAVALSGAFALASPPEAPAAAKADATPFRFRGTLHDALHEIAERGGIDLVISGTLEQPVDLVLPHVAPSVALETLAKAYHLDLVQNGRIWIVSQPARPDLSISVTSPSDDYSAGYGVPAPPALPRPPPPAPPGPPPAPGTIQDRVVTRQNLEIHPGETVNDAVVYGGNLTIGGHVRGDAVAFGGNIRLLPSAVIDGDTVAFGGTVHKADGARVHGEQVAFGGHGLGNLVAEGLDHGLIHVDGAHRPHLAVAHSFSLFSGLAGFFLKFVVCFGVGFLFVMFAPRQMKQVEGDVRRAPLRCLGVGFLAGMVLVVLTVLLAITIVGILPAILIWGAVGVACAMGFTALAGEVGLRLPVLRGKKTQASALALGLLVLLLLGLIPGLGWVVLWLASTVGFGAVVRTRFGTRRYSFPEPI